MTKWKKFSCESFRPVGFRRTKFVCIAAATHAHEQEMLGILNFSKIFKSNLKFRISTISRSCTCLVAPMQTNLDRWRPNLRNVLDINFLPICYIFPPYTDIYVDVFVCICKINEFSSDIIFIFIIINVILGNTRVNNKIIFTEAYHLRIDLIIISCFIFFFILVGQSRLWFYF